MSCIVAFRFPDRLVLGCDSLGRTIRLGSSAVEIGSAGSPKLQRAGPWHLMSVGIASMDGVDVPARIAAVVAPAPSILKALQFVEQVWRRELAPRLAAGRAQHPGFGELFRVGGPLIEVCVAGFEDCVPAFGVFEARLASGDTWEGSISLAPGQGDPADSYFYSCGERLAVSLTSTLPRPEWLQRGDAAAARRLLELQSMETPEFVGGDIDVVTLTAPVLTAHNATIQGSITATSGSFTGQVTIGAGGSLVAGPVTLNSSGLHISANADVNFASGAAAMSYVTATSRLQFVSGSGHHMFVSGTLRLDVHGSGVTAPGALKTTSFTIDGLAGGGDRALRIDNAGAVYAA